VITKNRRLSRVSRLEVVTARTNGIDYNSPKDRDQCWGAALPCVPTPPEGDVRLRVPSERIPIKALNTMQNWRYIEANRGDHV